MRENERADKLLTGTSDEKTLDTMIEYVNNKIHTEITLSKSIGYASLLPESAYLLDLTA